MTVPIILDTDIGTDVDDCLALALLLASPEIDLLGVTTVYGDVLLRSRMVLKLLALRGEQVAAVPVDAGASEPMQQPGPVFWEGHEGHGLLTNDDAGLAPLPVHATDFLIQTVLERPGKVHLVAIGPLTNLALAVVKNEKFAANLAGITLMGGVVGGRDALDLPWTEHNFRCDPAAARIVVACGAPLRIVPLDVTTQVELYPADVARIENLGSPFHAAVADQVNRYPRYQKRGATTMHDPLAVALLIRPDLVNWKPVHAQVETGGDYSAGRLIVHSPGARHPANAEIALQVDAQAAHDFIVGRLLA
jgi:purine nucleosidase